MTNFTWNQDVSCLKDNCSTMRGVRGGVETLVRGENPNLLDISGCTVHMITNVAKEMFKPFKNYMLDYSLLITPFVRDLTFQTF